MTLHKGWNHFKNEPEIVTTEKQFWINFLFKNIEKIVRILADIPDDFICIVCAEHSLNYTARSSLANHIKNHKRSTIEFWFNHIISKSPNELEALLNHKNSNKSKKIK